MAIPAAPNIKRKGITGNARIKAFQVGRHQGSAETDAISEKKYRPMKTEMEPQGDVFFPEPFDLDYLVVRRDSPSHGTRSEGIPTKITGCRQETLISGNARSATRVLFWFVGVCESGSGYQRVSFTNRSHSLPEPPPVFFKPFNKAYTEEVAERSTQNCADQNRVAGEERRFVKNEHARTEAKPATT